MFGLDEIALPGWGTSAAFVSQVLTNQKQQELAEQQMSFQERMSGTAYQRATADMAAAGLNPMLAYSQGGASTPGGAMAQIQNPVAVGIGAGATSSAGSASSAQARRTAAETMENKYLETKLLDEISEIRSRVQLNQQQSNILYQRYEQSFSERDIKKWDAIASEAEARIALDVAKGKKLEGEIDETRYGAILRYIDRSMKAIRGATSAHGEYRRSAP